MTAPEPSAARAPARQAALLRALLPAGDPLTAPRLVEQLGLWQRPLASQGRPRVLLNMVATADGRATLHGRSGPISSAADRQLFHALREVADGVLVGAGTAREERYGRLIADPQVQRRRSERGLREQPVACVVSGRVALAGTIPLLAQRDAQVVVLTGSPAQVRGAAADVQYVRSSHAGQLDLGAAIAQLRSRFAIELLLCEGGPHLAAQLIAQGLVDELFLTVSPTLAGGELSAKAALRITAGAELDPPTPLALAGVLEHESVLFLRYRVGLGGAGLAGDDRKQFA